MSLKHKRPPDTLLNELSDVAEAASAFNEAVRTANRLPDGFPKEAAFDLCTALEALPLGTAEGCKIPLEYARWRLPALRREFIVRDEPRFELDSDEVSRLFRGKPVDNSLKNLIAAVTTALDEYRRLASEDSIDPASISPEIDSKAEDKKVAIQTSVEVSKFLGEQLEGLSDPAIASIETGKNLIRVVQDAESINKLARAEVKQRYITPAWLRHITSGMKLVPKTFRLASSAITKSAQVAQPVHAYWDQTLSKLNEFLWDRYKGLALVFDSIADSLESKNPKIPNAPYTDNQPDIEDGFEHWAICFIEQKNGNSKGIDPTLFYSEVKHLTGMTSSEFARARGYTTFKELLRNQPLLSIVPANGSYIVKTLIGIQRDQVLRTVRENSVRFMVQYFLLRSMPLGSKSIKFSVDQMTSQLRYVRRDRFASYAKLVSKPPAHLFENLAGLKKVSNDGNGTFEIVDLKAFVSATLPKYLEKIFFEEKK